MPLIFLTRFQPGVLIVCKLFLRLIQSPSLAHELRSCKHFLPSVRLSTKGGVETVHFAPSGAVSSDLSNSIIKHRHLAGELRHPRHSPLATRHSPLRLHRPLA